MSHLPYSDAQEDAKWSDAELVLDFDPPSYKAWFSKDQLENLIYIQWFSRNVANCAFSMETLMETPQNQSTYAARGIPRSARRLKLLLQYFLWVLEHILYEEFAAAPAEKRNQLDIQETSVTTKEWTDSLRASLVKMDAWIVPATAAYSPGSATPTPIPAETMHELLGSFYIWTTRAIPSESEKLKDPNNVGALLRQMMLQHAQAPSNDPAMVQKFKEVNEAIEDCYKDNMKWGLSECIFTTQKKDHPETLVIGSTKAHYPAKTVSDSFVGKRLARLDEATKDELLQRFRPSDSVYMAPMIAVPTKEMKVSVDGLSKALVNFYIQQRQRTKHDWTMFNHRDQAAKSYYLVNTDGKKKPAAPEFFFFPVPRCGKCRTIMSYLIPDLEVPKEMDSYLTINPILSCAEDIVHAKLRKLYSDVQTTDVITPDANELSLEAEDARLHALDTAPDKDNDLTPAKGSTVQKKAVTVFTMLVSGRGSKDRRLSLVQLARRVRKLAPCNYPPAKADMTKEEQDKGDAAKSNIDKLNVERAAKRQPLEFQRQLLHNAIEDAKTARLLLANQVYTYLDGLKGFDLTGETT